MMPLLFSEIRAIRKALTRPIWWLERKRPRQVMRWANLPPVRCHHDATCRFAILGMASTFSESLWAAWSVLRFLHDTVAPRLYVDGEVTPLMRRHAGILLPGSEVLEVRPWLTSMFGSDAVFGPFLRGHPMAVKLLLVLALSSEGHVLYQDNDVLFFNSPGELRTAIGQSDRCYYLRDEGAGSWDPAMLQVIERAEISRVRDLNGGLHFVPRAALDRELTRQLIKEWNPTDRNWFTEQTVNAALFARAGAHPLPSDTYVVSNRRQFYFEADVDYTRIACRHFTGTVRHLMYSKGYAQLLKQAAKV
jgi:hypothetical protein